MYYLYKNEKFKICLRLKLFPQFVKMHYEYSPPTRMNQHQQKQQCCWIWCVSFFSIWYIKKNKQKKKQVNYKEKWVQFSPNSLQKRIFMPRKKARENRCWIYSEFNNIYLHFEGTIYFKTTWASFDHDWELTSHLLH